MRVKVNNKEFEVSEGVSVGEFLESLGYDVSYNTIMINGEVLSREEYFKRTVREGDEVIVVYLMAGG